MCNISEIGVFSRRERVVLDICEDCSVVWYGGESLRWSVRVCLPNGNEGVNAGWFEKGVKDWIRKYGLFLI